MQIHTHYKELIDDINSTVWARLGPSKIHGIGVIAIRDIPAGTAICPAGYKSNTSGHYNMPIEYLKYIKIEIRKLILDRHLMPGSEAYFTHPNKDADLVVFMNHSDKANSTGYHTTHNIKAGEEITENYNQMLGHKEAPAIREHMGHFLK